MNNNKVNITIIGSGIVGLSIAEYLSRFYEDILVIEKEKTFGLHTSSRNSEVIHSGFYYPSNSLKAKLCVEGNKMMYDFCNQYNIPHKKCGKLIVGHSKSDLSKLNAIRKNAIINGLNDTEIINEYDAKSIEENVKCSHALWVPSTGIVDSHSFMSKLENISIHRGVSFLYNYSVENIEYENSEYILSFENNKDKLKTNIVINSAGLWSDYIANKLNIKYEIEYFKGDYFKTSDIRNLNCLIYPLPTKLSLGIHVVINLNGEVFFGPNAYKVSDIDYETTDAYKDVFYDSINQLLDRNIDSIYKDYSGIRPKIKFKDNFNDFIIRHEKDYPNFYNLIGIDSPGLTSSLAIAKYLKSLM